VENNLKMADKDTTYSPKGHFPIKIDPNESNAGHFEPPSDFVELLNKIPLLRNLLSAPSGRIVVNPANANNPNLTIQHESIHGLLNPLVESGQLEQLNKQNPAYSAIAQKLIQQGAASPQTVNTEVPAYASTGEASQLGVDVPASQAYIDKLRSQLLSDPKLAGIARNF
jgi:hypothetical protein